MLLPTLSLGVTLSDNLSQLPNNTESVFGPTWITASFSTDAQNYRLTNATLLLSATAGSTANLYLFSNSSSQPGSSLGQLSLTSTLSSTQAPVSFSGNNLALVANSTYWLVLQAPTGTVDWAWTDSSVGTGVGFTHTWGATDDAGATWFTVAEQPQMMSVSADAASTPTVPEPSAFVLLGLGLAVVIPVARKRFASAR